jgi:hypothetical protein
MDDFINEPGPNDEGADFQDRLRAMLGEADVMSILFTRVAQSLIIDFRRTDEVGPRIMTDEIAASAHDRFLSFGRLRPLLPLPEQLTLAFWTPAVREFKDSGMLETLTQRSLRDGGESLVWEVRDSYEFLLHLERQYLSDMVRGVGMRTLWERERE